MHVALAEGRAADERWHVRKDGSEFWASGELMPLRREDGTRHGYVKILRDRTGPREAGERLRKTEDLFRTLLDTVETAFAIVEVKFDGDHPVDYRFLEANPAFERQAGVNLPHSSQALARGGQPVSMDQMQPGDVINYYSDASHTAIYIGDGMMVHASTYGTPVRVAPVNNAPIYNVRRY
jgi:hypothetical protein